MKCLYIYYNIFPWNTLNNSISYGLVVQYPTGDTYQQIDNSEQQHEAIKDDLDTMVEVGNLLNKQIDITVDVK